MHSSIAAPRYLLFPLCFLSLAAGCSDDTGSGPSVGATGGAAGTPAGGTAGTAGMPVGGAGAGGATGSGGGATGGTTGSGGMVAGGGMANPGSGGMPGAGGQPGSGGGTAAGGAASDGGAPGAGGQPPVELEPFSFFVASLEGMQRLSGSQNGFGGDLRYGEATGLEGADKICTELAENSMAGASQKQWRAFLSVAEGPGGARVDAIDRIGTGPWYDRLGRIVAMNVSALLNTRPEGADPIIVNDLPNEFGAPNHAPNPSAGPVDNHHVLTGSGTDGRLYQGSVNGTCDNWEATTNAGRPRVGFSWPAGNRQHWISGQDEGGCGAGVNLAETGGSNPNNPIVGSGGGYGAIYCFALAP